MSQNGIHLLDDGTVQTRKELLDGSVVIFEARNIRRERTGVHAEVTIAHGDRHDPDFSRSIAWDTFNISRHTDRNRLANDAWKSTWSSTKDQPNEVTQQSLQNHLMTFCMGVYPASLEIAMPSRVTGDDSIVTEFIAGPHCIEGGGTIFYGKGGAGKSYTLLSLAVSVDEGLNYPNLWDVPRPRNTLYINLERSSASIKSRLGHVNLALGLEPDRGLHILSARASLWDIQDVLEAYIEREGIEFVVLDSLTRTGMGDLTENRSANSFADTMNRICPSWAAIGHIARGDSSHVYGSVMFENAADVMVRVESQEDTANNRLGLKMDITKANDIRRVRDWMFQFTFDGVGVNGIEEARLEDFPDLAGSQAQNMTNEELIIQYLETEAANNRDSITNIASALGKDRSNIGKIIRTSKHFVKISSQGAMVYGIRREE